MLQLKNVKKIYQTKGGEVNALNGIDLTFPETGLVFISGKSGCGKTTLLNIIGGLDGIDEGEIYVGDKNLSTFSAQEYDNYRNTYIGFIFQEYNLLPEFTVEQNIKIAMELQGENAKDEEFKKLLADVDIEDLKQRKPSELSGGQRQRVAIARALVKKPRIIMADEPTGALDSATGIQVLETLKKLSKEKLVIIVSHDQEFAEKYADRIIYLVDGKITQDVSFCENEINANLNETTNSLIVKMGAELTNSEKDTLANAIKERKKISFTQKLSYRERNTTGEVPFVKTGNIAFKKSKMKFKSAALLGMKSLTVKPIRLAITIFISAIAFAVFGIFDTIANLSVDKVLENYARTSPTSTLTASFQYISDQESGEQQSVKVSQNKITELAQTTNGNVKPIYDLDDNTTGLITYNYPIAEIDAGSFFKGRNYYTDKISGFIEFNAKEEIEPNGIFEDFPYKLIAGDYPTLSYTPSGDVIQENMYQTAISSYLAECIIFYLQNTTLNGKTINTYEDLLLQQITVRQQPYTITGIIDCGAIPKKYNSLKETYYSSHGSNALADDFQSYINSGAHQCLFVAEGFLKEFKTTPNTYYSSNSTWTLTTQNSSHKKTCANYMYNASDFTQANIVLFNNNQTIESTSLASDEVLVHSDSLKTLLSSHISAIPNSSDKLEIQALIQDMDNGTYAANRERLNTLQHALSIDLQTDSSMLVSINKKSTATGNSILKSVRIVGVYFNVNSINNTSSSSFKFMASKDFMREFNVYEEQGEYSKILFSKECLKNGAKKITGLMTTEEGFALKWYNNSALNIIQTNKTTMKQIADLFLYIALALLSFSIFMLYNYISTSISNKRKSVGILRGLGASGKDVLLTFLLESMIIAFINATFASAFLIVGCNLINSYIINTMNISISFAVYGARQFLLIFGIGIFTALLSSALPIIKISKKKPVELIR